MGSLIGEDYAEWAQYYDADDDFYIPEDSADLRQFDSSDLFTIELFPKKKRSCFYIDVDETKAMNVTGAFLVVESVPIEVTVCFIVTWMML